ncbi:hypothetical protein [Methylosinus sp. Sm6]|uniref:hypothetical protein n=1 Tax=Methylosinus sp. Sm6 TaxID=2866948 RepID=UPI001C99F6AB|nr:hypothetical protein [Methylosinus sp. Sm6]MBY6240903.1 hypothetical protein [Methylosinus sp. Sm6]
MSPFPRLLAALATLAAVAAAPRASAHCMIGPRHIPMTLAIDTPCVTDDFMPMAMGTKNGDYTREFDVPMQWSKRITEDLGVTLAGTWTRMRMPDNYSLMAMPMDHMMGMDPMHMHGMEPMLMWMPMYMPTMTMTGWQNLQTTLKYQFLVDKGSELVLSAGAMVDWGGSGDRSSGAPRYTTLTPMLWFGKGFGDLPETLAWARPFAITGQFGLRLPTWSRTLSVSNTGMIPVGANMSGMINSVMDMSCIDMPSPYTFGVTMDMRSVNDCRHSPTFVYGASLQYNLGYGRKSRGQGVERLISGLTPLVEAQFRTPVSGAASWSFPVQGGVEIWPNARAFSTAFVPSATVGTINPGLLYVDDAWQIGAEAIIPINNQSGRGVGWMAALGIYLDKIFPDTIGRPLFGDVHSDHGHADHADHDHGDHEHAEHEHAHEHGAGHDHGADARAHAAHHRGSASHSAGQGEPHAHSH